MPLQSLSSQMLLFSNVRSCDGLSDENRQVIEDHCTPEWSKRFSTRLGPRTSNSRRQEDDEQPGPRQVYTPTEEEVALSLA